jgi:outer membrane protein OmpA-like peptidoglycan-associated protein
MLKRASIALIALAVSAGSAAAGQIAPADHQPAARAAQPTQTPPQPQPPPPAPGELIPQEPEQRPATTSFFGDTGLWFVPTAEVLPHGRWAVSGYRANFDREAGFTDISHFAATVAVGVGDRAELFGSWRFDTRIARRVRPLFGVGQGPAPGLVNEYPLVREAWTGDNLGDLLVGAKLNVLSQGRGTPVALAVRGTVKLPTGDEDAGVSTGRADVFVDGILSGEVAERVELAAFGGVVLRGNPDGLELSNGLRWGVGAGFPTRSPLRLMTELHGESFFDDSVVSTRTLVGADGTVAPGVTPHRSPTELTVALLWQAANGFFIDGGFNWNLRHRARSALGPFEDKRFDRMGRQIRVGFHPGPRAVFVPPLAPPPPPPPPPPAPPSVTARCEPCTVEVGKSAMMTADAQSPAGLPLTYRWTAPTGTFANPADRQTPWTAPMQEGPVPITVTVDDGQGGTASDTVTVQVIRPAVKEFVFEDVHFDFDRYSLRPEATRLLDEVVLTLQENRELRIQVEGHTCNIGTAEYNLALGERRAHAVRDYLTGRGIGAERLQTVSYGEERPKHDNAREETRRLNRRAALVVRVQ